MQFAVPGARYLCAFALFAFTAFAQDSTPVNRIMPGTLPSDVTHDFPLATPVEAVPGTEPLDFQGKTDYFLKSVTSPQSIGRIALTTGLGSLTGGSGSVPQQSFAESFSGRYAEHLTRRGVQFAIGAARGEDPRFRRSGREGFWARTKFVASRTVLTDMDNGGTSIAAGKLAGSFVSNTVSAFWHPARPDPLKQGLADTGVSLGTDFGMRMVREFWPDLKKLFKR